MVQQETRDYDKLVKLMVIGDYTGKTSLIRRFVDGIFL